MIIVTWKLATNYKPPKADNYNWPSYGGNFIGQDKWPLHD